jgi:hypothetical protein
MKVKMPCYKGNFNFSVFDNNKEPIDFEGKKMNEVITKSSRGKCLLELGSVFLGASISLTWKLSQAIVKPSSSRLSGYAFIKDSDGEDTSDEEEAEVEVKPTKTTKSTKASKASVKKDKVEKVTMTDSDSDSDSDSD